STFSPNFARLETSGCNSASSPCSRNFTVGWRMIARPTAATTTDGPASPPIASMETVRVGAVITLSLRGMSAASGTHARRSALRLHDLALAVMTAGAAHVMGTALLAAVRAFVVARGAQLVMRPAHVAARRRSVSFWDRHGGQAPSKNRYAESEYRAHPWRACQF